MKAAQKKSFKERCGGGEPIRRAAKSGGIQNTKTKYSRKTKGGKLFRGQSSIKEREICIYSQMAECNKNPNYPSKKKESCKPTKRRVVISQDGGFRDDVIKKFKKEKI